MIERYEDPQIKSIWSLEEKYSQWQTVELAVIEARANLGMITLGTFAQVYDALNKGKINGKFIAKREKVLKHDLNAFLEERIRWLPKKLRKYFHQGMTSYDTEETPFIACLGLSCKKVDVDGSRLLEELGSLAIKYRFTPMNARTHGQEAEMQSFGKRCLTWYKDLATAIGTLRKVSCESLYYSKLSGAIGTNSGINPELEKEALEILGFRPWDGATQIMPRILYSPIAGALADIAMVLDKIATDIRLGSRSGRPLWHEPFGKSQKGSSAMPHKKNNIGAENTEGMAQMARHYAAGIKENIKTWEERAIAQSSVERVFWPDLFHVVLRAVKNMTGIIGGLVVYPDNMMIEIVESRGTYASNAAKEFLTDNGLKYGIDREMAYRIVQLACFNAFEPGEYSVQARISPPHSHSIANLMMAGIRKEGMAISSLLSIESIIATGSLRPTTQLTADDKTVKRWNTKLLRMFHPKGNAVIQWMWIFSPSHILTNEAHLFKKVFGV